MPKDNVLKPVVLFDLLEQGIDGRDGYSTSLAEAVEEVILERDAVELVCSLVAVVEVFCYEVLCVMSFSVLIFYRILYEAKI